jgi:colicin import membrane protein
VNPNVMRQFRRVALVHGAIVLLLFSATAWRRLIQRREPESISIAFTVAVPPMEPEAPPEALFEPETPEPAPQPKPARKPIERSARKVTRTTDRTPRQPRLTEEQIRRLLEQGARPADRTSIPEEDARCFEIVRRALYETWAQPAAADAGGLTAEAAIRIGPGGQVSGRELRRGSGSAAFDQSVRDALETVRRIEGLTPGFIGRHPSVSVLFKIE